MTYTPLPYPSLWYPILPCICVVETRQCLCVCVSCHLMLSLLYNNTVYLEDKERLCIKRSGPLPSYLTDTPTPHSPVSTVYTQCVYLYISFIASLTKSQLFTHCDKMTKLCVECVCQCCLCVAFSQPLRYPGVSTTPLHIMYLVQQPGSQSVGRIKLCFLTAR